MPTPRDHAKAAASVLIAGLDPDLPFTVELWNRDGTAVERVIARAGEASVIGRMFEAAILVYPERKMLLKDEDRILREHCRRGPDSDRAG